MLDKAIKIREKIEEQIKGTVTLVNGVDSYIYIVESNGVIVNWSAYKIFVGELPVPVIVEGFMRKFRSVIFDHFIKRGDE